MRLGTCKFCLAQIGFVRMAVSGKDMPVDPAPNDSGTVVELEEGGHVLGKGDSFDGARYVTHFYTCPKYVRPNRPAKARR